MTALKMLLKKRPKPSATAKNTAQPERCFVLFCSVLYFAMLNTLIKALC